jgi:hypothetical protein
MFEDVVAEIQRFVDEQVKVGRLKEHDFARFPEWRRGKDVILRRDLAFELGKLSSALLLLWGRAADRVYLPERIEGDETFAIVVICDAEVKDPYESFKRMRDAFYSLSLKGLTIRSVPSRMQVWCRISRQAVEEGFDLGVWGRAIVETMNALDFISSTDVLFIASNEDMVKIGNCAERARRIVDALIKMGEERLLNCNECDYQDVCSEIPELRKMRERLLK